jgi:hypothetical protein
MAGTRPLGNGQHHADSPPESVPASRDPALHQPGETGEGPARRTPRSRPCPAGVYAPRSMVFPHRKGLYDNLCPPERETIPSLHDFVGRYIVIFLSAEPHLATLCPDKTNTSSEWSTNCPPRWPYQGDYHSSLTAKETPWRAWMFP